MADDELDKFINEILDAKQLSGVTADVRTQLVSDLKQRLLDQINRALVDVMPDDKITEFNNLLDDENLSDEAVQQFITDSGVDVSGVTLQTMLRFSELYIKSSTDRAA